MVAGCASLKKGGHVLAFPSLRLIGSNDQLQIIDL